MSGLLVNPVFIAKFYKDYGGGNGSLDTVNPSITGISVSCLQVTAAIGALVAGRLGDMIGRKKCVRIGAFIYFFTAFMQMFAPGFDVFVAGRTIQGLGVGFLSMTVPIIQTEIAAPHARGLMVGIEYTFLIAGYMLSCWVDYGFNFLLPGPLSWQGPFIIQIVLSFILFAMSYYLPETPRWLAKQGFLNESLQTVADLHTPDGNIHDEKVQSVFLEIQEAVRYEETLGSAGWGVSLLPTKIESKLVLTFHCRKCSPPTVSALLSASPFRCSHSLMGSTSSHFTCLVPSPLLASTIVNRFFIPVQTLSHTSQLPW